MLTENMKEWMKDILVAIVISVIVMQFIKPTIVREHSMEETLRENDYILLNRQAYGLFGEPQRGDIVVFESSLKTQDGGNKLLVKRIIAIPGDTISIKGGWVIINDEPVEEEYIKDGYTSTEMQEISIPAGFLFAMGDNRQNSMDSRDERVGLIALDTVVGKAFLRLFPFSKIGGLY